MHDTANDNPGAVEEDDGEDEEVKEPVMLRVGWRIQQIDYPTCLDYFVLDYYDITYNESTFSKTINRNISSSLTLMIFSFQAARLCNRSCSELIYQ